jgi:hypothetical protein
VCQNKETQSSKEASPAITSFKDWPLLDAHASLYLLVPARLSAWLPGCLFQLALGNDDINAHPLRPMSYWFLQKITSYRHSQVKSVVHISEIVENLNFSLKLVCL